MKRFAQCLIFAILFSSSYIKETLAQTGTCDSFINPVMNRNFADPTAIKGADGYYYVYGTNSDVDGNFFKILVSRSTDLVNWEIIGDALPQQPVWADKDFWAPHVIYDQNLKTYFLYYSGESKDEKLGKCIGVATSKNAVGPFVDSGNQLIFGTDFKVIDPMAFDDPATGKKWLYWGSGFEPIRVQELNDDRISFKAYSEPKAVVYPGRDSTYSILIEGSWLHFHDGYYYLFYSGDNCCGDKANYAVMIARSKSPEGPFERLGQTNSTKSSAILEKNERWLAPGHNSVITDKASQDWIVYHAIDRKDPNVGRKLLIDRISYLNGWPVINDGTPSINKKDAPFCK